MKVWTYQEAFDKLVLDLDLQDEVFVDDPEIMGYFNEAIDQAEAEILKLYQDYFRKPYKVPVVDGNARYSLPTDIYANKIRAITYTNGLEQYMLDLLTVEEALVTETSDDYGYQIENVDAATGPEMVLYPSPDFTDSNRIVMWYIRNANRIENSTDLIDIPEFINYIFAYVRERVAEKELHPLLNKFTADRHEQETRMKTTLDNMIPDGDNVLAMDTSFYFDFDSTGEV